MSEAAGRKWLLPLSAVLPLVILASLVWGLFTYGPGVFGSSSPLPMEQIDVERMVLNPGEIAVSIMNSGTQEVTVAQVFVNDAIWDFHASPSSVLPRLSRATLTIPYDWVYGEPVAVTVITANGFTFDWAVEAAISTPVPTLTQFFTFGLIGTYVGVIPVFLGFAWLPFLNRLSERRFGFLLSLTAGLLLFLGVDALEEALNLAGRIPGPFQGLFILVLGLLGSFLGLVAVAEWALNRGVGQGQALTLLFLAYLVALGIGLHNLGEGLAIGAAYALGEISLGAFLIIGFTLHNTTEGLAILAPVAKMKLRVLHLALLGGLAGIPTIFGAWIGGFTYSAVAAVLFLAVGGGAIFQVVYEVFRYLAQGKGFVQTLGAPSNLVGILCGLVVMYLTGLFVTT